MNFPYAGKHGIFRFWDRVDPSATPTPAASPQRRRGHARRRGRAVDDAHGGAAGAIASPGSVTRTPRSPPGDHTYAIELPDRRSAEAGRRASTADPVLLEPDPGRLAAGRSQESASPCTCRRRRGRASAPSASARPDGVRGRGRRHTTSTVTTGALDAHTRSRCAPVRTWPTPDRRRRPWTAALRPGLRPERLGLLLVVARARPSRGVLGCVLARCARADSRAFPLMYGPPDGHRAGAGGSTSSPRAPTGEAYVATMMYAAERGAVDLERGQDSAWTLTDAAGPVRAGPGSTRSPPAWRGCWPARARTFVAVPSDVSTGKILQSELTSFESSTRSWARQEGLIVSSGLGGFGGIAVLGRRDRDAGARRSSTRSA